MNWDSNGSGVAFHKVRAQGNAFDMVNAAAVIVDGSDDLAKYVSGSLGFTRDGSFMFTEENASGSYLLFGAANPLSGTTTRFTLLVHPDHRVTSVQLDESDAVVPSNELRWEVGAEGRLVVSLRQDVELFGGLPTPLAVNSECVDENTCFISHERIEHPITLDGNLLYVLEEQIFYAFDPTAPFGKGEITKRQGHIRYWEVGSLPAP